MGIVINSGGPVTLIGGGDWVQVRSGGTVPPNPLLVLDQFTDPNGTLLSAHVIAPTNIPATTWTVNAGGLDIQSNRARGTTNSVENRAHCESGQSNMTVSATSNNALAIGGDMGLLVRYQDTSNYWLHWLSSNSAAHRIYEFHTGAYTVRASAAQTVNAGQDYVQQVVASGTSLTATIDGANSINYTSAFLQTQTKHGLYQVPSTQNILQDNFQVTSP